MRRLPPRLQKSILPSCTRAISNGFGRRVFDVGCCVCWRCDDETFATDQAIEGVMTIGHEGVDHSLPIRAAVPYGLRKVHQPLWRESFMQYPPAVDLNRGHCCRDALVRPFVVVGDAVSHVEDSGGGHRSFRMDAQIFANARFWLYMVMAGGKSDISGYFRVCCATQYRMRFV